MLLLWLQRLAHTPVEQKTLTEEIHKNIFNFFLFAKTRVKDNLNKNSLFIWRYWWNIYAVFYATEGHCAKLNSKTRSIQRTQIPPRLWPLTLLCGLHLLSRSRKLMSVDVAYGIVPLFQVWCLWDISLLTLT